MGRSCDVMGWDGMDGWICMREREGGGRGGVVPS